MNALSNTTKTILVLLALGPLAYVAGAQAARGANADFTNAVLAEVKDGQGQVVLSGKFVAEEDDDDVERKATLTGTAVDADARGEAEVEVSGTGAERRQEVELSLWNVQAGAAYTLVIDGTVVATVTANDKGRAKYESETPLTPTAGTPRER